MKSLIVAACVCVLAVSAQNMYGNMQGNMGNMMGMMGNMMGMNMPNMGNMMNMGNMGNMANMMGNRGQMGNNQGQGQGQDQGQGQTQAGALRSLMSSLIGSMMGSLLMNRGGMMGNQMMGGQQGQSSGNEMERMMEMMNMGMWQELFEAFRAYDDFKDKEENFKDSMKGLCAMIDISKENAKNTGQPMYVLTTEAEMEDLAKRGENWSDEEWGQFLNNLLQTDSARYQEYFWRIAEASCWTGWQMGEALEKLEAMDKK